MDRRILESCKLSWSEDWEEFLSLGIDVSKCTEEKTLIDFGKHLT